MLCSGLPVAIAFSVSAISLAVVRPEMAFTNLPPE